MGQSYSHANEMCEMKDNDEVPHKGLVVRRYPLIKLIAMTDNSVNFLSTMNDSSQSGRNKLVVVKFIRIEKEKMQMIRNELIIMELIKNNAEKHNIIQCIDMFKYGSYCCIVTPFEKGGTLLDHFKDNAFNEESIKEITKQILESLRYLHSNNIVHRDVKLQNVYLESSDLKHPHVILADFGCAAKVDGPDFQQTVAGTPVFIAPEIYKGEKYGPEVDVWSLGVTIYGLMAGKPPFPSADDNKMKENVIGMDIQYPKDLFGKYSSDAIDLVKKMLNKDPSMRITAEEALKHHWFNARSCLKKVY